MKSAIIGMANLTFGEAIDLIKKGKTVQRSGWDNKNMFIYLNKGSFDRSLETAEVKKSECYTIDGICKELFETGDLGTATRLPSINMKSANGSIVTGWSASQADILAEDWNECDLDIKKYVNQLFFK